MILFINFLFIFQLINGENLPSNLEKHYDMLIFTQAWPLTSCYEWEQKSSTNKCNLPANQDWSIHGLWPNKNGTFGPFFCNDSLHFNISALDSLRQQLDLKWIDVHKGAKPYEFWRHEWEKHGSCSVDIDCINTEKKYFEKTLELFNKYDMKYIFDKANIFPNKKYFLKIYLDRLYKIMGKNVYVECTTNKKKNETYISELRICFNKKFELINCNGIFQFPSNCNKNLEIIYPTIVPDLIRPFTTQI